MRIIFAGSIGRLPVGGHAWVDMQYLLGLRELGHEVVYVEECGSESWVYNWRTQELTTELGYPTDYLRSCLDGIGFAGRWIYRAGDQCVGMGLPAFKDACTGADLMLIRAVPVPLWRPEYDRPRRHAFIDMDPLFTQIQLSRGHRDHVQTVEHCDRLFTIGQRLGAPDCTVPLVGREWIKTVPPIALSHWPPVPGGGKHFTSVLQWRSYQDVEYDGVAYGNKSRGFPAFLELPRRVSQTFLMALTGSPPERLTDYGWHVVEGWDASETVESYQRFIQDSRAEFSVAKHGYVASRCGWFSDRSVCYLASGRPILVQDTGLADGLPVGEGVLTFSNLDEAVEGVERINRDYENHGRAARGLAEKRFATEHVLPALLETAMQ